MVQELEGQVEDFKMNSSGHQEGDFNVLSFKSKYPDMYNGQDMKAT